MSYPVAGATERVPVAVPHSEGFAAVVAALDGRQPLSAVTFDDGSLRAAALALVREGSSSARVVAVLAGPLPEMPKGDVTVNNIRATKDKDGNVTAVDARFEKGGGKCDPKNAFDCVIFPHGKHIANGYIPGDHCVDCHKGLDASQLVWSGTAPTRSVTIKAKEVHPKVPTEYAGPDEDGEPRSLEDAYDTAQSEMNQQCEDCHAKVHREAKKGAAALAAWGLAAGTQPKDVCAPSTQPGGGDIAGLAGRKGQDECKTCHTKTDKGVKVCE